MTMDCEDMEVWRGPSKTLDEKGIGMWDVQTEPTAQTTPSCPCAETTP